MASDANQYYWTGFLSETGQVALFPSSCHRWLGRHTHLVVTTTNNNNTPNHPQCCLPEGVEIVLADDVREDAKPKQYPIVLTDEDGQKLYGTCLTFLDWVPEVLAVQNDTLLGAKASKCLCILSRFPFVKTFQRV